MDPLLRRELNDYVRRVGSDWISEQAVWLGKIEDGAQVIETGTPGELFARQANDQVITVKNSAHAPAFFDLHVLVRRSRFQPAIWQITEVLEDYDVPAGAGVIAFHHEQHEFRDIPGPDTVWISRKQILELTVLVSDPAGFIVQVVGAVIRTSSGLAIINNEAIDLSSYVPSSGARFVTIQSSEAGVLSVVSGSSFGSPYLADLANVPEPDPDNYMIAFVLLYEGLESLSDALIRIPHQFHPGGTIFVNWGDILGDIEDQADLSALLGDIVTSEDLPETHSHGLTRLSGATGQDTFDLWDIASQIESLKINGLEEDPIVYSLSADGEQVILDTALTSPALIFIHYIIAGV